MPMRDSDKNCLIYNVELYEIDKLKSKFNFSTKTKSDTKVLFEILKRNDPTAISELNGMFAFSFFNSHKNELVLGRDKLGIKPIYYSQNKRFSIIFSSEIKPLISNNLIEKTINSSAIESYILFSGFNSKEQIINNVHAVEPGELIIFKDNKIKKTKYFSLKDFQDLDIENQNNLSTVLREVVNDQLIAEVPVNILLSGGIDSSLIASVINSEETTVNAFNLSYKDQEYDESSKAKLIASELGINLKIFEFDVKKNNEIIDEIFEKLPEPISDPSIVPTYYLSKMVSAHTKAVLVGDGADELFSGYEWYRGMYISQYIPKFIEPAINKISKYKLLNNGNYLPLADKVQLFTEYSDMPYDEKLLFWQSFSDRDGKNLSKERSVLQDYLKTIELKSSKDTFENIRLIDLQTYLYTNILKKGDISSMLNGLEIRPIFLDDRIMKYALSNKVIKNINILSTKTELRKLLYSFSKEISKMKKHGFAHDFGNWTETEGMPFLTKNFNGEKILDSNLQQLKNKSMSKYKKERSVWKLYSIYKWLYENKVTIVD